MCGSYAVSLQHGPLGGGGRRARDHFTAHELFWLGLQAERLVVGDGAIARLPLRGSAGLTWQNSNSIAEISSAAPPTAVPLPSVCRCSMRYSMITARRSHRALPCRNAWGSSFGATVAACCRRSGPPASLVLTMHLVSC